MGTAFNHYGLDADLMHASKLFSVEKSVSKIWFLEINEMPIRVAIKAESWIRNREK